MTGPLQGESSKVRPKNVHMRPKVRRVKSWTPWDLGQVGCWSSRSRLRSWAKRFGPSWSSQAASVSATASRITCDRGDAALSEDDPFGAEVVRVRFALEVSEAFELAEEVVERLLADSDLGGDVGRTRALRSRVSEHGEVGAVEVVEAALMQPLEHVLLDRLPGNA